MSLIEPESEPTFSGPLPVEAPETPTVEETPVVEETVPQRVEDLPDWAQNIIKEKREGEDRYRRELREYEAAFEGYTVEERQAYLDYAKLVRAAQAGDPDAQAQLAELMEDEEPEPAGDQPQYLTREEAAQLARQEAQALIAERDAAQAQQQAVSGVQSTAKELGYEPGSEDYLLLLHYANQMDNPDLRTADAQVKAYRQQLVDSYLASKEADADNTPNLGTGNGVAVSTARVPRTFAEARESLHERLTQLG